MGLGIPYAEYEATVGPLNRRFHERAEMVHLAKQGVVPIDEDDREEMADDSPTVESPKTHGRG